jgi:segregation and condensation protein B
MRLSRAALETLAIIAYKQPVTKSEIEAIRGVDSSGTLATLLERALVTIKGRSTVVGRPLLYGSTPDFLNYFGLRDLTELPRPEELRALVAAREPEQLDMLELDGDGMPLALAASAEAFTSAGAARPSSGAAAGPAADDETDAAAIQVSGDAAVASDAEEAAEDEFEDEDEYDDDDDDEDEEDAEDDEDDEGDGRPSATLTERNGR